MPEFKNCNEQHLATLLSEINSCRICIDAPAKTPLPHEPRPVLRASSTAKIIICGQAPGKRVHTSGIPFTDPSGLRLRHWMGIDNNTFYDVARIAIIPMGFCFPGLDAKGGDLPPRSECARTWRHPIFNTLAKPDLILLVGFYAQKWHLGKSCKANLTQTVAAWRNYMGGPTDYIPLPHPSWRNNAWLKRNQWFERDVLPMLRNRVYYILNQTKT